MLIELKKLTKSLLLTTILVTGFAGIAIAESQPRHAQLSTKEEQKAAVEEALRLFEFQYAGYEEKEKLFGVTSDKLREKYYGIIERAETMDEFYKVVPKTETREALSPKQTRYLISAMVSELHDGHAGGYTPERGVSGAGIRTVSIDGRLYVSGFIEKLMGPNLGRNKVVLLDEVMKINDQNIDFYKRRNLNLISNGTIQARKDEALERILEVPHALLPPLFQNGEIIKITFRRGTKEFSRNFKWQDFDAIHMTRPLSPSRAKRTQSRFNNDEDFIFGEKAAVRSYFMQGLFNYVKEQAAMPNGRRLQIFDIGRSVNKSRAEEVAKFTANLTSGILNTPENDRVFSAKEYTSIQKKIKALAPVTRLKAYIVTGLKKPIAVLRIPSYVPKGAVEAYSEIEWLRSVIEIFNSYEGLDTLIFDELSNPGGSVGYARDILSLFSSTDQPLVGLSARFVLSQTIYNDIFLAGTGHDEFIDQTARRKFLEFIETRMNEGHKLSPPLPFGMDFRMGPSPELMNIRPKPKTSTWNKKTLLLIDSRSASCAEIVAAALQDNKLAEVQGEVSMGLGYPYSSSVSKLNLSEITLHCPFAICHRINGTDIENIGIIPDIKRLIRVEDVANKFVRYAADTLNSAESLSADEPIAIRQENILARTTGRSLRIYKRADPAHLQIALGLTKELESALFNLNDNVENHGNDWLVAYNQYFTALSELEASKKLRSSDWNLIYVPLPKALVESDPVLRTSFRKDIVLRRIEEMLELNSVKSHPQLALFLKTFHAYAVSVQGFYNFKTGCSNLLTSASTSS